MKACGSVNRKLQNNSGKQESKKYSELTGMSPCNNLSWLGKKEEVTRRGLKGGER